MRKIRFIYVKNFFDLVDFQNNIENFADLFFRLTKLVFRTLSEHDKNPILTKKKQFAPQTNIFKKKQVEKGHF